MQQPSPISEARPNRSGIKYDAPELFPQARVLRGDELRDYVEGVMVELARDGKLRVTDLLNQGQHLADVAGRVLFGERIRNQQQTRDPYIVKPELSGYMVRLRALPKLGPDGEPTGETNEISWKKGMEPVKTRTFQRATVGGSSRVELYEDVWLRVDGKEALLPLPLAYLALKQAGKFCRKEAKIENQRRYWRFEEVLDEAPRAKK